MPRPNRYHPYNRGQTAPPLPSPRYPAPPALNHPKGSLQPIADHQHHLSTPSFTPYKSIYPDYITGITLDGKTLVTRSILQTPDGTLHVQYVPAVGYPSEYTTHTQAQIYLPKTTTSMLDPRLIPQGSPLPMHVENLGPESCVNSGLGSGGSEANPGMRGLEVRKCAIVDDECAIVSEGEDVDAEGEEDGDRVYQRAVWEQRRLMLKLIGKRAEGGPSN